MIVVMERVVEDRLRQMAADLEMTVEDMAATLLESTVVMSMYP